MSTLFDPESDYIKGQARKFHDQGVEVTPKQVVEAHEGAARKLRRAVRERGLADPKDDHLTDEEWYEKFLVRARLGKEEEDKLRSLGAPVDDLKRMSRWFELAKEAQSLRSVGAPVPTDFKEFVRWVNVSLEIDEMPDEEMRGVVANALRRAIAQVEREQAERKQAED